VKSYLARLAARAVASPNVVSAPPAAPAEVADPFTQIAPLQPDIAPKVGTPRLSRIRAPFSSPIDPTSHRHIPKPVDDIIRPPTKPWNVEIATPDAQMAPPTKPARPNPLFPKDVSAASREVLSLAPQVAELTGVPPMREQKLGEHGTLHSQEEGVREEPAALVPDENYLLNLADRFMASLRPPQANNPVDLSSTAVEEMAPPLPPRDPGWHGPSPHMESGAQPSPTIQIGSLRVEVVSPATPVPASSSPPQRRSWRQGSRTSRHASQTFGLRQI
jgi:hypothetical protein